MKKTIASALFLAAAVMAPAALADDSENIKQMTVNEFTVYPILDSRGEMDAALFSGPLSDEEKAAYMPGGKAPSAVNIFLLKTPSGNVLIDTGWGKSGSSGDGEALGARMKMSGLAADDVDLVILTHMHPDHIGGLLNGRAPFFSRARLMVSAPELEYWAGVSAPAPGAAGRLQENGDEPGFDPSAMSLEDDEEAVSRDEAPAEETPAASAEPSAVDAPVAAKDLPRAVIEAYGDRLTTFEFGSEVVPGLTALEAVGHTPGHTALLLKSGDRQLLFIGDLIHAAALQFPEPEESASFDQDKEKAVASRRSLLALAADSGTAVAGAHIPFPGLGFVQPDGKRGFTFTPVTGSGS